MKRFWKEAAVAGQGTGWRVELDSRPLRTPARALLKVPSRALADAVAQEWAGAGEQVDPRAMPLTGLANAAIDHVAPDKEAFAAAGLQWRGHTELLAHLTDAHLVFLADRHPRVSSPRPRPSRSAARLGRA